MNQSWSCRASFGRGLEGATVRKSETQLTQVHSGKKEWKREQLLEERRKEAPLSPSSITSLLYCSPQLLR